MVAIHLWSRLVLVFAPSPAGSGRRQVWAFPVVCSLPLQVVEIAVC